LGEFVIAVVTGASRGIGRAIAVRLATEGADVVGVARSVASLESLGAEIRALGRDFLLVEADLARPEAPAQVADEAFRWRGRIDSLVSAAGMLVRKPEADLSIDEWDVTFALNVRAPFALIQHLGPRMYEAGGGAIVSVASIAGERVTGAPAPYQASKAALIQLTRFFAKSLAPRVRVNAVGPGYVFTEFTREWLAVAENQAWVVAHTPLGRVATPEDIVAPVAFLLSEGARYITGQHLLVDGGWSVG
jgi:NAD(P)-dependent dehydrogenase (short-subunit alcohol dehydrogenase family)